jgi:hypothetical protein
MRNSKAPIESMRNGKDPLKFMIQVLAITFAIAFACTSTSQVNAQTAFWRPPSEVSSGNGGWFPDIVADEYGRIHVVWASTLSTSDGQTYDVVMYRMREASSSWSEAVDLTALRQVNGESYATRPVTTIGFTGVYHLAFRNSAGVQYTRSDSPQLMKLANWIPPQEIVSYGYFAEVVEDRSGLLRMIYTANVPTAECAICFHIFDRTSTNLGHTWSIPEDISVRPDGAAKPVIVLDAENGIHMAWEAGEGGDLGQLSGPSQIYYARLDPETGTWTRPALLSEASPNAKNPALGIQGNGDLLLVYFDVSEGGIYYRQSGNRGATWAAPLRITGIQGIATTALDRMDMARDSSGNLHLVLVGALERDPGLEDGQVTRSVLHTSWDGIAWAAAEEIATYVGDVPEWPGIAVSGGNELNVVWFVRDAAHVWDSDSGNYAVWYSSSSSDAPRETPVPTPGELIAAVHPTSAPMDSEVTLSPSSEPTKSLSPGKTYGPVEPGLVQEADYIVLLLKSIIPVVLLVAGFIGFILFRRE